MLQGHFRSGKQIAVKTSMPDSAPWAGSTSLEEFTPLTPPRPELDDSEEEKAGYVSRRRLVM